MPELIEPIMPPQSQEGMPMPDAEVILDVPPVVENPPESMLAIDRLNVYLEMTNIAEDVDDKILLEIGSKVVEGYNIDKDSRSEWEDTISVALELAKQISSEKYYAGELVANVKYPSLATAAIAFSARALPNIVKGRDVVKAKVIGLSTPPELPEGEPQTEEDLAAVQGILGQQADIAQKDERANRVGTFMSYQFLEEIEDWVDSLDQLLASIPIIGCAFKKTYYDSIKRVVQSPYVDADNLVVNFYAKSFLTAPRATHILEFTKNEIEEKIRGEIFLDKDFGDPEVTDESDSRDEDRPYKFLEQHTWWDLDDDGYKEPYIITVHKETEQVVRISARFDADGIVANEKGKIIKITPVGYFTRFLFMPAFDGNFYGMGFGSLVGPLNATINDTINQLLDAGTRANRQGGFLGKGIHLGKGAIIQLKAGQWLPVNNTGDDLRKGIVPLLAKDPSPTLFHLLGTMLEATKEVSSVADVLTGETQGANASPTTTLALIEQGLKVFSSIYKRLHRSLKSEFQKVRRLNRLYLDNDHYRAVLDDPAADVIDFYDKDMDVMPVSDETELTHIQKLIKAEALNAKIGTGLNDREINKRYLEALDTPDIEKVLPPENKQEPPPPEYEIEMAKIEVEREKLAVEKEKVGGANALIESKIRKNEADIKRSEATARKTNLDALTDEHMEKLDSLTKVVQMQSAAIEKLVERVIANVNT